MPFGMRKYTCFINHDFSAVTLELKPAALVHTNTHVHILRAVWLLAQGKLCGPISLGPHGEDFAAARPPHNRPTTAPRPPHDRLWETKRFAKLNFKKELSYNLFIATSTKRFVSQRRS